MAKAFGQAPIDLVLPTGGYSDFEAESFNVFVFAKGREEENKRSKEMERKMKRSRTSYG